MPAIHNRSGAAFSGCYSIKTDKALTHECIEWVDKGVKLVRGKAHGEDTTEAHLVVDNLPAGQSLDLPWVDASPCLPPTAPKIKNILAHFGGGFTVQGAEPSVLPLAEVQDDDFSVRVRLAGRLHDDARFHSNVWLQFFKVQPAIIHGVVTVTHSHPESPRLFAALQDHLSLKFGDGHVYVHGTQATDRILARGEAFGDGQSRIIPFTVVWSRHAKPSDLATVACLAERKLSVTGFVENLYGSLGSPTPTDEDRANYGDHAMAAQHDTELSEIGTDLYSTMGVAPASPNSGAQEDQVFRGHEVLDVALADQVNYMVALKMANRPNTALEPDGQLLAMGPENHSPIQTFFNGRCHEHPVVSPNQRGKPRHFSISELEDMGWYGPDVEHWLMNRLTVAARINPCPALQWMLHNQAVIYSLQMTTLSNWSTSGTYASRSTFYEGLNSILLVENIADRKVAQQVAKHAKERLEKVLIPAYTGKELNVWDVRRNDNRTLERFSAEQIATADGKAWMPWQQSVGAWGLHAMGVKFGVVTAALAKDAAIRALDAWQKTTSGEWKAIPYLLFLDDEAQSGVLTQNFIDEYAGPFYFPGTWMLPGLYLAKQAGNGKAREVFAWLNDNNKIASSKWVPPTVVTS